MRVRKLLASVLVPALLAIAALGAAPTAASALPHCEYLEAQYMRYAGLASMWFSRYQETGMEPDLWRAQEYEELRVQTAQSYNAYC
jgi:hypothetical protein